ncbi:MAG: NYN domain-containing protein [Gammaproteobacteria bacterium]|nr:MAG: NYN domain-containing protein [Gammaproteobacteria bacterium]
MQPTVPCAVAFVDGQNLFHCAREAYGYTYPNFDPKLLAQTVCFQRGWRLTQTRFYSGVPPKERDPKWHGFWARKTLRMTRAGVHVTTRPLRYTDELLSGGTFASIPREKGIDVRIAIDVLTFADRGFFDVAVIFSQDQDLAELVSEIRNIAARQNRWIKLASAFPVGPGTRNTMGIRDTDWIRLDKSTYDGCLDPLAP